MNLYDIQNDIDILLNQVDENGELPEETFALIEQLQITEGEKIDNIACYIKALKAESEAIANEIGILTERKRAKERKESSLREYLSCYLWSVGKTKVESAGRWCRSASRIKSRSPMKMRSSSMLLSIKTLD